MTPASAPYPSLPVLNCDLGEGEPETVTGELMALIGAANIACGGHAGTDASMRHALASAHRHRVLAGAHPGLKSAFGRSAVTPPTPLELQVLLIDQITRLAMLAREVGVPLHHVKLHGALYHQVDASSDLRTSYLATLQANFPPLAVFARCGGACAREASQRGMTVWEEAFLDRGYRPDGTLVQRGERGDLIVDPALVRERLESLIRHGGWPAVDGTWIPLAPRTLCIHGDSPHALDLLHAAIGRRTPPG
ncbi:MAG: LamB/YcsF family protein [Verrucomicrobiales bacterium]|nr:LamB/YcsF family protein [Verrucomicrobiales bacterium]